MPNAQCLLILTELREQAGLSLSEMARRFGLEGTQSRKTVGAWEHGEMTPRKRWRGAFMRYLWDDLGLRRQPKQFAQVWDTLVEEWGWEPITDAEWHAFTTVYRQGNDADRASALILPGRARAAVDTPLQLPSPIVRVPAPAAPGGRRVVKGYELREKIGAGRFGAVYRAYHPLLDREVAIKTLLPQHASHPDFIRRFEAEAQRIARLDHPQIVPLYDFWREPDGACLVMRFFRSGSLHDALDRGPVALAAAARILAQIGAALSAAHTAGVLHRNLKPANILLDAEGNAYLSDFGIAVDPDALPAPSLTGGSPRSYRAPEQSAGKQATPQTDIYSFGMLMLEVLAGAPVLDDCPGEAFLSVAFTLTPPTERGPALTERLRAVIQKATARRPADRYHDVPSMLEAFRLALMPFDARWFDVGLSAMAASSTKALNPYRGLRPFEQADSADFFGRDMLIRRLLERLSEEGEHSRFLAVVGPSGSGKSSVVRAGVVPALRRGALPGSEHWFFVELLPGAHPLEELEAALLRVAVNPPPSLLEQLHADARGLLRAVKRVLPADPAIDLVLVIDQFEELFTLVENEATRAHLLASLLAAVTDSRSRLRVVLTLRADFYDRPLRYQSFSELLRLRTEVVVPLTPDEVLQSIVGPASRAGLTLEPGLASAIAHDVDEQPGTLPLLQYALSELCERRDDQSLTLAAYHAIGGVHGALARRAEEIYRALDQGTQEVVRQLFLRLITLGEGSEDTRRRVLRSELASIGAQPQLAAGFPRLTIDAVIDTYGRAGLLTFDSDPITRGPTVEVAHEALLSAWGDLRAWLEHSRADVRMQRLIAAAAAEWSSSGRDPSYLLSGARLAQFEGWAEQSTLALNQAELVYLQNSVAERDAQQAQDAARSAREASLVRRSRNILRALVAVLLFATVGALGLLILAIRQGRAADLQAAIARESAAEAQQLALATGAQAALSQGNTVQALALALAANHGERPLPQAELILSQAAYAPGVRWLFNQHHASVRAVAFSPDGRQALSGSTDRTLILWDLASGQLIRRFEGHTQPVTDVVFSPDGQQALSSSADQTLLLWDVASGQPIHTFAGHTDEIHAVAFSPDGRQAASVSDDRTLILWDVASGQPIHTFAEHADKVRAVAFSPDGRTLLVSVDDRDPALVLWDIATRQSIRRFEGHTLKANDVKFSADGRRALSASDDKQVILWDVASGQPIHRLIGHADEIETVAFSPDGKLAVSGSRDTNVILWDVQTGAAIGRLAGHGAEVTALQFSPDGRQILTGSGDNKVRLWDLENGAELRRFAGHADGVVRTAFSPDGRQALSSSLDTTMMLWDVASGRQLNVFRGHTNKVYGIAFSPDGHTALSGSRD